jgi:hypothetical protein
MFIRKIKIKELEHLKVEFINHEYIATLIDSKGYGILKGYGSAPAEALNDLHKNLI